MPGKNNSSYYLEKTLKKSQKKTFFLKHEIQLKLVSVNALERYGKSRGRFFDARWWKVDLAFAHRQATLNAIHKARDKILPEVFNFEELMGEEASSFHDNSIFQ